jgi:UDP-N-acetylglucosamine 2-epimerase (non-hydrolysing)
MRPRQALADVTARILEGTARVIEELRPTHVVVQGDTATAFAAALAAYYARVPVAHVEAGLRSGERDTPFPEEANRRLVDQLSDVLFAPTTAAADLLAAEGHPSSRIHVTGNTVVDALLEARETVRQRRVEIPGVPEHALRGRVVLVTAHRRESFGAPIRSICRAVLRIVRADPEATVVWPVHLNPEIDGPVRAMLGTEPRVFLTPPLGYLPLVALLDRAMLVLTDSGGIQEEAPSFGTPVLVLREVTERPEAVEAGIAQLVGTDRTRIVTAASQILRAAQPGTTSNPYGDGRAGERIADIVVHTLTGAPRITRDWQP